MVLGLRKLNRKLTHTIPNEVRRATRKAMEKGANEIVTFAKTLVPVRTGELRDSIGWTWGDAPEGVRILAQSVPVSGGERITIFAGNSEAFYARWQEFGTVKMAPSPYFFPAYRALRRRVKSRITRETNKAIKRGARG